MIFRYLMLLQCLFITKGYLIPYLNNIVGENHKLMHINKDMILPYLKQKHIDSIKDDLPFYLSEELSQAHEMCQNFSDLKFISILKPIKNNKDCDYVIFYRRTNKIPCVFTIEGIYRIPYSKSNISYWDVLLILNQFTEKNGVYLQTNELKLSNNTRFHKIISIEKNYNLPNIT